MNKRWDTTDDIYKKYFVRSKSDRHYLWVGRISGVGVTLLAVCYAVVAIQRVLYSFLLTETAATFVGISILLGMFWRRANRWGAGSSIVVAFGVNFAGYSWTHSRLDSWEPNIVLVALLAGIVTAIGVSLITAPEPKGATDDFYRNLNTSSDPSPQGSPAGHSVDEKSLAESGRQLIFVNLFHLQQGARGVGFFRAYRVDLLGFSFGWIIAFLLIIGVFLLFRF